MVGNIILLCCCWVCAASFLGLGLFARRYQKPMWFWSGTTVAPESISDISAYNRANSRMWLCFSLPFWACGFLSLWYPLLSGLLLTVCSLAGIPVLPVWYGKIYKKYKRS